MSRLVLDVYDFYPDGVGDLTWSDQIEQLNQDEVDDRVIEELSRPIKGRGIHRYQLFRKHLKPYIRKQH